MIWSGYAFGMLFAAACSFFFALAESALLALGKWRAQHLAEDHPGKGAAVVQLFLVPEDLIAALTLGNTLANGTLIGLTVWMLATSYSSQALGFLGALTLILVGCEAIPKALAVRAPEFWAIRVATPIRAVILLTKPLRRVAQRVNEGLMRAIIPKWVTPQPGISEDEYQELLEMAQELGAVTKSEKLIILRILELDQRTAREVMKPRSQISFISDELSREEMLEAARRIGHTRIPIYDETPDTIVGVLNARAFLLNPEADLEEVMEFPSFVPETMNLLQLLRSLQRQQRGIAIVLDEFGGTAGLITLQDILEDVLGFITYRTHEKLAVEKLGPGRWRVSGLVTLEEFRREYPALEEVSDVDTMSGLLVQLLEYVPSEGESVTWRGLKLTATKVGVRKVDEMLVESVKK